MFINLNIFRTRIFFLLIIAFAMQIAVFGQKENSYKILTVSDKITESGFYPFGGYLILGKKPAGFTDFYSFSIENTNLKEEVGKLKIVGAVMTSVKNANNVYRMETLSISAKSLFFKTETLNNVHYEFKGKYLKTGDLRRFYKNNTKVLQGKFIKFVENKEQESATVNFYFKVWKAESYYKPD